MIQTWNWKNQGISLSKAINLGISSLAVLQYLNNISFLLTIIIILLLFLFLHSIQLPQYNHDKLKKGSHIKPVGTNMAQHQDKSCSNIRETESVILFISCRRGRNSSSRQRRYAEDDDESILGRRRFVCFWLFLRLILPQQLLFSSFSCLFL